MPKKAFSKTNTAKCGAVHTMQPSIDWVVAMARIFHRKQNRIALNVTPMPDGFTVAAIRDPDFKDRVVIARPFLRIQAGQDGVIRFAHCTRKGEEEQGGMLPGAHPCFAVIAFINWARPIFGTDLIGAIQKAHPQAFRPTG